MSQLWPDTFVEEANLTFNIQQLRETLGDNARRSSFTPGRRAATASYFPRRISSSSC